MAKLIAVYKEFKGSKATKTMTRTDYKTKTALAEDLRGNGYAVVDVFTEKQVMDAAAKPHNQRTNKEDLMAAVAETL